MTDQLFLSIWLERHARGNLVKQFEKLLRLFPFSQRQQPQSVISVLAVSTIEPPLLEKPLQFPVNLEELLAVFDEYSGDDVAYTLEAWWDLWQHGEKDWELAPARVLLSAFRPGFDNGTSTTTREQEDLRIDFGVDTWFLPNPEIPGSAKLIESNVKGLLHLTHDIDSKLAVERRQLQTESGMNFAQRLEQVLRESAG